MPLVSSILYLSFQGLNDDLKTMKTDYRVLEKYNKKGKFGGFTPSENTKTTQNIMFSVIMLLLIFFHIFKLFYIEDKICNNKQSKDIKEKQFKNISSKRAKISNKRKLTLITNIPNLDSDEEKEIQEGYILPGTCIT